MLLLIGPEILITLELASKAFGLLPILYQNMITIEKIILIQKIMKNKN